MTPYTNGQKKRKDTLSTYGHYVTVYLTSEQYEFLQCECEKLNMKAAVYMRELLQQLIEESKAYLKK